MFADRAVAVDGILTDITQRVLIVQIAFYIVRPVIVQTGDGVQALGIPGKGIVFAHFIQPARLVPLVEREYRVILNDLAGMGLDFFDDEPVSFGLVVVGIFPGIAEGQMPVVDFKFLAPMLAPVSILQRGIRVPCRAGKFHKTVFALVCLMVIYIPLFAFPAGEERTINKVYGVQAIVAPDYAVMGALFVLALFGVPFLDFILGIFCDTSARECVALFPGQGAVPGVVFVQSIFGILCRSFPENFKRHDLITQVDQRAALVLGQYIGIIVSVPDGDRGAIVSKADIISPFAGIFRLIVRPIFIAGPVAVVSIRGLGFHHDKLAVIGDCTLVDGEVNRLIVGIILRVFGCGAVAVHSIFSDIAQGILVVQVAFFIL